MKNLQSSACLPEYSPLTLGWTGRDDDDYLHWIVTDLLVVDGEALQVGSDSWLRAFDDEAEAALRGEKTQRESVSIG